MTWLVIVVGIARQEHEVEAPGHHVEVEPFSEKLAERGWGRAPQVVTIEEGETQDFRIVYRRWPVGVDPFANTERIIDGKAKSLPPSSDATNGTIGT